MEKVLARILQQLELLTNRLISAENQQIQRSNQRYIAAVSKLDAMSPLKVLTRGYAMAQTEDGAVVKSVSQVKSGDQIKVSFSDSNVSAMVTEVKENGI